MNLKDRIQTDDAQKFVIHPYYTGRDKGALGNGPDLILFDTEEEAWEYIFTQVQPNDPRAKHNYAIRTLKDYAAICGIR
jgi:hypothetical protein